MKKNKTAPAKPTLSELRDLIAANKNLIVAAKAKITDAENMILALHGSLFDKYLTETGLTHGQHSAEIEGVKLTFKVSQRVDWDSDVLESIANTLPWEQVRRIMKIDFSVPEKNFKALEDNELKDRLMDARTVKYASTSVSFS